MKRYTPDSSINNYVVPEYSDAVDGPGAFKAFADGLDLEHIVPIKTDVSSNANEIAGNASDIKTLANRLDALENTTLSAEWTIAKTDGSAPADGELSLNDAAWANVTVLKFSSKDKNGTEHDFTNVKPGDTIQIGVGPEAKLAGSSAAYTVESVTGVELVVNHLSSTGAPTVGFTAIVAVYPQFDPSGYATIAELEAVEADKLSRGDGLVAATAKVLEDAINTNADSLTTEISNRQDADQKVLEDANSYTDSKFESIKPSEDKFDRGTGDLDYADAVVLGQAVTTNKGGIQDNATSIENLAKGLNVEINADGSVNIIGGGEVPNLDKLETDISKKFDIGTGTTNLNDATTMEAAINSNAVNIEALVEVLGGSIDNIENIQIDALPPQDGNNGLFLTTDGKDASWAAPKTGDIALSADDTNSFVVVDELGEFKNQSEVNTFVAENGLFKGTMITWGDIANKTDA